MPFFLKISQLIPVFLTSLSSNLPLSKRLILTNPFCTKNCPCVTVILLLLHLFQFYFFPTACFSSNATDCWYPLVRVIDCLCPLVKVTALWIEVFLSVVFPNKSQVTKTVPDKYKIFGEMYWVELQNIEMDLKDIHPTDNSNWNEIRSHMRLGIGLEFPVKYIYLLECNVAFTERAPGQ